MSTAYTPTLRPTLADRVVRIGRHLGVPADPLAKEGRRVSAGIAGRSQDRNVRLAADVGAIQSDANGAITICLFANNRPEKPPRQDFSAMA